ncbi:CYTH domain-containing protein [Candidatus Woesearchaeota archaeon]|nr:CYTH domain-containing protein [Candidatus Woesearchaeota archaeon]
MIEVELKFQVLDEEEVKIFLKDLEYVSEKRIVDVYLDTVEGDLFKKGIFIRVRDGKKLDFKYNLEDDDRHEHCDEHSFVLPLGNISGVNSNCKILGLKEIEKNFEEFKEKNNLINSMTVDKVRKKFKDEEFEYCLDKVEGMGLFLEIEAEGKEGEDLEAIKAKMREKLKGLDLKKITTGYNEIYWRKHNFELYMQGKYLLEEDKV